MQVSTTLGCFLQFMLLFGGGLDGSIPSSDSNVGIYSKYGNLLPVFIIIIFSNKNT